MHLLRLLFIFPGTTSGDAAVESVNVSMCVFERRHRVQDTQCNVAGWILSGRVLGLHIGALHSTMSFLALLDVTYQLNILSS